MVKDGSGTVRQRYDYYPYGTVSNAWTSSSTTDNSEKRYRFGGKEVTGAALSPLSAGSDAYLDFGARLYSPRSAVWLSLDPMAEKYYPYTPYAYCAGNPANLVDPEGKSWYFSLVDGSFIAHIDDEDDLIYMLTLEQMNLANGDYDVLQSYKSSENSFGYLAREELLNQTVANNVVSVLFDRANQAREDGGKRYIIKPRINAILYGDITGEEASSTSNEVNANLRAGYYRGYDVINLFAHEIGHILHRKQVGKTAVFNRLPHSVTEKEADRFAKRHWSNNKISAWRLETVVAHASQNGYNWYEL